VAELASWVGDALHRALLNGQGPAAAAGACAAFLHAYAEASRRPIDAAQLAFSVAHDLLCRRAWGGVANLKPGRYAAVPALLALADAIAAAGTIAAAFTTSDPPLPSFTAPPARHATHRPALKASVPAAEAT
jgi:hypothetical protein